jgi:hypothetical protein
VADYFFDTVVVMFSVIARLDRALQYYSREQG